MGFMQQLRQIDPKRAFDLVIGVCGIYVMYLFAGILHEYMIKQKYSDALGFESIFTYPVGLLIFPTGITWAVGWLVNQCTIPLSEHTHIPPKKALLCAITVSISTITYTYAIYWSNYPVVMMVKSCNILSVILVSVLCSRVKDQKLKLGSKKILVGVLVTLGIVVFKYYDQEGAVDGEKKTEVLGIVLLIISLLADGFLPDFQAEIKSVHKPQAMQLMTAINKWVCILSFGASCVSGQIVPISHFLLQHHLFLLHMLLMGVLSTVGQMFVYRMIKQFKQHIVPFVITTRKIVTVGLSILYFHHETNYGQIIGILIVFLIVTYEFFSELTETSSQQQLPQPVPSNSGNSLGDFLDDNQLDIDTARRQISSTRSHDEVR